MAKPKTAVSAVNRPKVACADTTPLFVELGGVEVPVTFAVGTTRVEVTTAVVGLRDTVAVPS
jgi:alpha-D-ribose 1-methylphosphonate 5-phosphate C-P lyase